MKSFSTYITEGAIEIPEFIHPQLNKPNDPDGKFWMMLKAVNSPTGKSSYKKMLDYCKSAYQAGIGITDDPAIDKVQELLNDAITSIENAMRDVPDEMSVGEVKAFKSMVFLISTIDKRLSKHRWYKSSTVDIKAGYIPFRGSAKDPKIKYRMVVKMPEAPSEQIMKGISKDLCILTPVHRDYVASTEWNKEHTAFMITFTNTPGYRR